MLIKTRKPNLKNISYILYGQDFKTHSTICEVFEIPLFKYEELTENFSSFTQTCINGVFFQTIINGQIKTRKPTIKELKEILLKLDQIGVMASPAQTLNELDQMLQIKELQEQLDIPDNIETTLTIEERISQIEMFLIMENGVIVDE